MPTWRARAVARSTVRTSLRTAGVVGPVAIATNRGGRLAADGARPMSRIPPSAKRPGRPARNVPRCRARRVLRVLVLAGLTATVAACAHGGPAPGAAGGSHAEPTHTAALEPASNAWRAIAVFLTGLDVKLRIEGGCC